MTPAKNQLTLHQPAVYHIAVAGRLSEDWSENFGGMEIHVEQLDSSSSITHLTGTVPDQSGLHGLLHTIRDLGLPLLRVEYIACPEK